MSKITPLFWLLAGSTLFAAPLKVSSLQTEHETNPIGVSKSPRLSWQLEAVENERGKRQTKFHLLAASSAEKLAQNKGDLWDSAETKNASTHLIAWAGKPLKNGQNVHWKVKVWDEKDEVGNWSEAATFKVGKDRQLQKITSTSSFKCSNPTLNEIFNIHKETLGKRLDKFVTGDVKALGFGTSVQTATREYLYHFNSTAALSSWTSLMHAGKDQAGYFPVLPGHEYSGLANSDSAVIVPHSIWWMSGDQSFIKDHWKSMDNYMVVRERADQTFNGRVWGLAMGDNSLSGPSTPRDFIDLCYLGLDTRFMKDLALPGNEPLTAIRYKDFTSRLQKSFAKQYLNDKGELTLESQTSHLLALRSSLIPSGKREPVLAALNISLEKNGLQAGPLGTQALFPVLTFTGKLDQLFDLITKKSKVDWSNEKSQFIGTGTTAWMMSSLAGIDTSSPGFQQIRISPQIPSGDRLNHVKAEHQSAKGLVKVEWRKTADHFTLDCTIPPNTLAIINLPADDGKTLTESGKSIEDAFAAQRLTKKPNNGTIQVLAQSGSYQFKVQ